MGDRAGDPRPRTAGPVRHVRPVESIAGREIRRTRPEPNLGQTPSWKSLVAQDAVEEEIYKVIEHSNLVQVHFSTEFVGFEEVEDGVICEIRSVDPAAPSIGTPNICSPVTAPAADAAQCRHRAGRAFDALGSAQRILARRPLALSAWRGSLRLHVYSKKPACRPAPDPQHQRQGPLAFPYPDRPGEGRAAAALDGCGDDRDHPRPTGVPDLDVTLLKLDLAHEPAGGVEFPEAARVPGRRCRPSLSADRRLRPELRRAGRA